MKHSSFITASRIAAAVAAIAFVMAAICLHASPAYADITGTESSPSILVTYGKGAQESGTWNENILTVNDSYAYCVEVAKPFRANLSVNAIDPVANGIWTQDLCTRLALIDEVVWSGNFWSTAEAGKPAHRVTDRAEKYAIAQCYIWKALDDAGFSNCGWFSVAVRDDYLTGRDTDAQIRKYIDSHKNDYVGHASYYNCGSAQNMACRFRTEPAKGHIQLQKRSANEEFVAGNDSYSLEGAVYGVYADESCSGSPIAQMVTDVKGRATSEAIPHGDYFVKETSASPGYQIDPKAHPVHVIAGKTVEVNKDAGGVLELPKTGGLSLSKSSALKDITERNALFTNENAVFGVYADEACTVELAQMVTGKQGGARVEGLPLGPKFVREIRAPKGMALDQRVHLAMVKADQVTSVGSGTVLDTPKSCAARLLIAKYDGQKKRNWDGNLPQGAASLENAEFTVRYFGGFFDNPKEALDSGTMMRSWVFKTDPSGRVFLDGEHLLEGDPLYTNSKGEPCLPLGTVLIEETKPPMGYLADTRIACVQIADTNDGEFQEDFGAIAASNTVKRGDLEFVKVSSPSMQRLAGVPFRITSLTTGESHVIVTDANGYASTASSWNAHSSHTNGNDTIADTLASMAGKDAEETQEAPDDEAGSASSNTDAPQASSTPREDVLEGGLSDNPADSPGIQGDETTTGGDGTVAPLAEEERLDASIEALGEDNGVESATMDEGEQTGEAHSNRVAYRIDVADRKGNASPALALAGLGASPLAFPASESMETPVFDPDAGIWFGMDDSGNVGLPVDDALGALPYDTYAITELPCPANSGLQLIEASVVISRDRHVVDLGTLDDPRASITTSARDGLDGDSVLPCSEEAVIIDRLSYANLIPGREYIAHGTLVDGETGEALLDAGGNPIEAIEPFTPASSTGHVELAFNLSTLELQEASIVVFEDVLLNGHQVAAHADLEDHDQELSVSRPAIGTIAADGEDGDNIVALDARARVADRVSYSGLTPGVEYRLSGTLMSKAENAPLVIDGKTIDATLSFTPDHSSGTVEMVFEFDTTTLEDGTPLVVFEKLTCNGKVVAAHEDLQDRAQTVVVARPQIQTSLRGSDGKRKAVAISGNMRLIDSVSYEGLIGGRTYEVVGTLMDRSTGKPALDANGKAITARSVFTPEVGQGSVEVCFAFDGSTLGGHTLVAFESLLSDGIELTAHANIRDEEQSIVVNSPKIETKASVGDSGSKKTPFGQACVIHDAVTVSNVNPESEYTVVGMLMDKATNLPLILTPAPQEAENTATTAGTNTTDTSGMAELWSSMLKAANVGYTMRDEGNCITLMQATDIDFQAIDTAIKSHPVEAEHIACVSQVVKPSDSTFDLQMDFKLESITTASQIVVFEALVENETGKLVAVHADFADVDQTVEVETRPSPKKDGKPQASSGSYDKTGNLLARYAWVFALIAAVGCASTAYGIAKSKLAKNR